MREEGTESSMWSSPEAMFGMTLRDASSDSGGTVGQRICKSYYSLSHLG